MSELSLERESDALVASAVRHRYGDLEILHDVSLRVGRGEFVAITGPSGSGKSTLLRLLGTLERPASGQILIAGVDCAKLPERELAALRAAYVGFIFQQFFLLDALDAVENVELGLLYRGTSKVERRRRAVETLERVGLAHRQRHRPSQLSGGERQRVAVARAIVGRPLLVLADEPTGNLDTRTGADVIALIRRLQSEDRTTVVLITHDRTVARAADRGVSMRDGRMTEDEPYTGHTATTPEWLDQMSRGAR